MSNIENGGPEFPVSTRPLETEPGFGHQDGNRTWQYGGMTLREYAAIKLRVPESGTDWLDEMIRNSVRNELAAKAMQGFAAADDVFSSMDMMADGAHRWAEAMQRARESS